MASDINNASNAPVQSDEISLKELIFRFHEWYHYLLTKWKAILLAGMVGGALGFMYAHFKKPIYTATCTFVLDNGGASGIGQYSGLAALAGINLGGDRDGLFMGENILELYKSRTMLQKALLSYGKFDGKKELLINRYIKVNNVNKVWAKDPKLKYLTFDIPVNKFTRANDSVMTNIVADINRNYLKVGKVDKKLSIIKVDVNSTDEEFAKYFNDAVVKNVNDFYIETKTKKANDNIRILQNQADSVRRVLNNSIGQTASALDVNPNANLALQVLKVPSQRRQVDIQANSSIYAEVVKNLELARLSASQDAPLIQVVDPPIFPLSKSHTGKFMATLLGSVCFVIIASIGLVFRFIFAGS